MKRFFSFMLFVIVGVAVWYCLIDNSIPERIYKNTLPQDVYADLLKSKKNVIFWVGNSASIKTDDRRSAIDSLLKHHHYNRYYSQVVDLSEDSKGSCYNGSKSCVTMYLKKECTWKFCLIITKKKLLIKVPFNNIDKLLKILEKYKR